MLEVHVSHRSFPQPALGLERPWDMSDISATGFGDAVIAIEGRGEYMVGNPDRVAGGGGPQLAMEYPATLRGVESHLGREKGLTMANAISGRPWKVMPIGRKCQLFGVRDANWRPLLFVVVAGKMGLKLRDLVSFELVEIHGQKQALPCSVARSVESSCLSQIELWLVRPGPAPEAWTEPCSLQGRAVKQWLNCRFRVRDST